MTGAPKHVTTIESWRSEFVRAPGKSSVVRWSCSCGRLGPGQAIGRTKSSKAKAFTAACRGARQHQARPHK